MKGSEVVKINLLKREPKKVSKKSVDLGKDAREKGPSFLGIDRLILLLLVALFAGGFLGYYLKLTSDIGKKEDILKVKRAELKKLSWVHSRLKRLESDKKELQRMIAVVKSISSGRDRMVRFFNGLESAIPSRVWLYQLQVKGAQVSMKGYAMENRDVADFIENLDRLREVDNCRLGYIKRTRVSGIAVKDFTINTFLRE